MCLVREPIPINLLDLISPSCFEFLSGSLESNLLSPGFDSFEFTGLLICCRGRESGTEQPLFENVDGA